MALYLSGTVAFPSFEPLIPKVSFGTGPQDSSRERLLLTTSCLTGWAFPKAGVLSDVGLSFPCRVAGLEMLSQPSCCRSNGKLPPEQSSASDSAVPSPYTAAARFIIKQASDSGPEELQARWWDQRGFNAAQSNIWLKESCLTY